MPATPGRPSPAAASSSPTRGASRRIRPSSAPWRSTSRAARFSGRSEWQTNYSGLQLVYAIGPRATPTVDGDRVYVLGAMGNLLALDVKTGGVIWQKDYVKDFNASVPTWGITGAPLVDGDRLICLVGGEPDAKVIALDKRTGEEIWRALSSDSEPGYNQPIIIEAGGVRQLIIFHPKASRRSTRRPERSTGRSNTGPDGDRRGDAGPERPVSVLHVAVRRRAHAAAGRHQAWRRAALERSR